MNVPIFEGYELEWVNQADRHGGHDPETCQHDRLMTYSEDDGRFCGCRDCGTIWEMYKNGPE